MTKYTVSATKPNIFFSNTENSIVSPQYKNRCWLDAFFVIIAAVINKLAQTIFLSAFHEILLIDISDPHVSSYKDSQSWELYKLLEEKLN